MSTSEELSFGLANLKIDEVTTDASGSLNVLKIGLLALSIVIMILNFVMSSRKTNYIL
jgi:hypothetical protein